MNKTTQASSTHEKNTHEKNIKENKAPDKTVDDTINQEDSTTNTEELNEELEQVKTERDEARESAKESYDKMIRTQAEMENLRRRNAKDIKSSHKFALEKFTKSLLEVVDSMAMGLKIINDSEVDIATIKDGMQMTHKMMIDTLEKFEITPINPEAEEFNPEKHEAINVIPMPDTKSNTIVEVVQIGWELSGRVLRPAMVVVAQ